MSNSDKLKKLMTSLIENKTIPLDQLNKFIQPEIEVTQG